MQHMTDAAGTPRLVEAGQPAESHFPWVGKARWCGLDFPSPTGEPAEHGVEVGIIRRHVANHMRPQRFPPQITGLLVSLPVGAVLGPHCQ